MLGLLIINVVVLLQWRLEFFVLQKLYFRVRLKEENVGFFFVALCKFYFSH